MRTLKKYGFASFNVDTMAPLVTATHVRKYQRKAYETTSPLN